MTNKIKKIIFLSIISFGFVSNVYSANVFWERQNTDDDDITLNLYLNSDKKEINVIEGKIKVDGEAIITGINKDKSIFSIWPEEPKVDNNLITFVGGTPSGVFGNKLKIFSINIKPTDVGNISAVADDLNIYLSDGSGSSIKLDSKEWEINIDEIKNKNISRSVVFVGIIILLVSILILWFFKNRK